MVTNYTSMLGGKKIQFGYTWLSPIMCSNPFLLKASHVYSGLEHMTISARFKKILF